MQKDGNIHKFMFLVLTIEHIKRGVFAKFIYLQYFHIKQWNIIYQ